MHVRITTESIRHRPINGKSLRPATRINEPEWRHEPCNPKPPSKNIRPLALAVRQQHAQKRAKANTTYDNQNNTHFSNSFRRACGKNKLGSDKQVSKKNDKICARASAPPQPGTSRCKRRPYQAEPKTEAITRRTASGDTAANADHHRINSVLNHQQESHLRTTMHEL